MKFTSAYLRGPDKNGRGRWQGFLRYKNEAGKWRQISMTFSPTVKTKRQAEKALQEWRNEMELQEVASAEAEDTANAKPTTADVTVGEYVSDYVDTLEVAGTVRPSAVTDYRNSAKRITEGLGGIKMGELTTGMIQKWEAGLLRSGRSASTVLKYHRLLNSVFRHAIDAHELAWNPCTAVKKPRRKTPMPNSLTNNQLARLAATLASLEPTPTVTAAAIAAYTGMREGEICGLRWKSYDKDTRNIRVVNAIAKAGGKTYETEPKTSASRRDVPVSEQLAVMLERRRVAMVEELQEAGIELDNDEFGKLFVIGTIYGQYQHPVVLSKSWKELAGSFGLIGTQGRPVTFHDLRHTFATTAIAGGSDVKAAAGVLGHSDAHVTLNVYADSTPDAKRRTVNLVAHVIAAQGNVEPFAENALPG